MKARDRPRTKLQQERAAARAQKEASTSDAESARQAKIARRRAKKKNKDGTKNHCKAKMLLCLRKMGCGKFQPLPLKGISAELAQHLLFTNRELNEFQLAFDQIDLDGSKELDYDEFLEMLEERRSPYTDALFALVDDDAVCWSPLRLVVFV